MFFLLFCFASGRATAQTHSPDGVWMRIEIPTSQFGDLLLGPQTPPRPPGQTSVLVLKPERLKQILSAAPKEFSKEAKAHPIEFTIPLPNGQFQRFKVEESPVAEGVFEAETQHTRTYQAVGIDDPTARARIETSLDGFHAVVRTWDGVFYVDPIPRSPLIETQDHYLSYLAEFITPQRAANQRHCEVTSEMSEKAHKGNFNPQRTIVNLRATPLKPSGGILKIYRLALAVNSFYVNAVYDPSLPGSKLDQTAGAIKLTVDRVNEIYQRELGIRLILVSDEDKIIYTDSAIDPYIHVNSMADYALSINQLNLDHVIGSANYDIGHLFTTDTAGLAQIQAVCNNSRKAQGVTGIAKPFGDHFNVTYVAHEIGHQFGADHTFNGTTGGCYGNRNQATAYEPGSGSTIMAYAGICYDPDHPGITEDLQSGSDDYFHLVSLEQIRTYIEDTSKDKGGSCPVIETISTDPPATLGHQNDYVVPKSTPFALDAQPGSQATPSAIKYTWEEYDLGDPGPPDDENGPGASVRPIFRSYRPGANTGRVFPSFSMILNNAGESLGESYPMIASSLAFRITVRNDQGAYVFAETHVMVDGQSGPFKVTTPGTIAAWQRGKEQQIKWDPANADRAPVNCKYLKISFLVDGNPAKSVLIAQHVPNQKGNFKFKVPVDLPLTNHGRLKLEAEGNIFFAVSPADIHITAPELR
jgi:hypothetical protein